MKHLQKLLPSALLFSYCIYSAFIPVTIAHSIIIASLAVLYSFHFYISRQDNIKLKQDSLDSLKNEMELKILAIKEIHEKKISKLEDDLSKLLLSTMPKTQASSSSAAPRKMVF